MDCRHHRRRRSWRGALVDAANSGPRLGHPRAAECPRPGTDAQPGGFRTFTAGHRLRRSLPGRHPPRLTDVDGAATRTGGRANSTGVERSDPAGDDGNFSTPGSRTSSSRTPSDGLNPRSARHPADRVHSSNPATCCWCSSGKCRAGFDPSHCGADRFDPNPAAAPATGRASLAATRPGTTGFPAASDRRPVPAKACGR